MSPIPLHLAIEDELSEAVARRLLSDTQKDYFIGDVYGRGGFGYLRNRANSWNAAAAAGVPILLLTDLDLTECAPALIDEWLTSDCHPNLLFRIAVREVESWLLADRQGFAQFLGIANTLLPPRPDQEDDPKRTLVRLASRARSSEIKKSITPRRGSTAKQGPNYNECLCDFVRGRWNPQDARVNAPSLDRAWHRFMEFEPTWPKPSA